VTRGASIYRGSFVIDVPPPSRRNLKRALPVVVGLALMAICGVFIAKVLADDWHEVRHSVVNASWMWLGAALGLGALGMVIVALTWADAVKVVGGKMRRSHAVPWYFEGEIGKYIPGAVWAAVGRGEIARRKGMPAAQAYPSVGLSLIGLYLAAALTAAAVLPFDLANQKDAGPALLLLLLVPVGLALLHPRVLGVLVVMAERATKRSIKVTVPVWRETVVLVLRYVPAWVAIAGSTWCVARALPGVDAPVLRIALATLLSWTAGFVTPTPGGAGVREAVFIAVSGLAAGPAVAVAVTSRLIFVLVDVGGALGGLPATRRRADGAGSVSSPPPGQRRVAVDEEG
jgi:uncharacterized membrane protein YbhN (UPF0104 family)